MASSRDARGTTSGRVRDESGFTLVEVTWALFLLGLVAMGSLALFVSGMRSSTHLQREQAAVMLANSAMDQVRAVAGGAVNSDGTSGAVKGRARSAVQAVWDAADAADTADMNMLWDPASGLTAADQWVPIRSTSVVDNVTFTTDVLVGSCFRPRAASTGSLDCVRVNPNPTGDTYVQLLRVRVVISWNEGSGVQTHRVTTLVDPSADATWNTAVLPYAYDDEFSVIAGAASTFHAIVANDTVDYNEAGTVSPVTALTQPAHGSVAVNTALGLNGVVFTPPADVSGTVTFTYRVRDTAGQVAAADATVGVHILPSPLNDDFNVEPGITQEITSDLLANDRGVPNILATRSTRIVAVWDPAVDMFTTEEVTPAMQAARTADAQTLASHGVTVDGSGRVWLDTPTTDGDTVTFYYYLVDRSSDPTQATYANTTPARVTVKAQQRPLVVVDQTFRFNATPTDDWHPLDWLTATGNQAGDEIRIVGVTGTGPTAGLLRLDGGSGTQGQVLEVLTRAETVGVYAIQYQVVAPDGRTSTETKTLTVEVLPVASDSAADVRRSSSTTRRYEFALQTLGAAGTGARVELVRVNALARPATGIQVTSASVLGSGCGSVTILSNGRVRYTAPNSTGTCFLQYQVQTTGTPVLEAAAPATVTVTVTNRTSDGP